MVDTAALAAAVEDAAGPAARRHAGLVVGVGTGRDDVRYVTGHGALPDVAPERVLVEIGSVTKVFTASLLMLLAGRGVVGVEEPVQDLLPDGVRLPVKGRPVTLLDLATHRSGLPRLPLRWLWRFRGHGDDPYAVLSLDDVWTAAATCRRRSPGAVRYSNLGAGLLGHALEHRTGRSYADLVGTELCAPLGLADTTVGGRAQDAARTAPGHDAKGRTVPAWHLPVLAAAGGLHSTAADLLTFLRAQEDDTDDDVHRALRATHEPVSTRLAMQVCAGWMSVLRRAGSDERVLWHNGGTGGYRSWAAFVPGRDVRVVVLATDARPADRLGQDLVAALAPV